MNGGISRCEKFGMRMMSSQTQSQFEDEKRDGEVLIDGTKEEKRMTWKEQNMEGRRRISYNSTESGCWCGLLVRKFCRVNCVTSWLH